MNWIIGIVETQMVSSQWTAVFTFVSACFTPLTAIAIFLYGRSQKKREAKLAKIAADIKEKTEIYERETKVSLEILQSITHQTHILVNSRFGMVLKKLADLARNHATMARQKAHSSKDQSDMSIAEAAEAAAQTAESDFDMHERQQAQADKIRSSERFTDKKEEAS